MNIADVEREKALKAQNAATPTEETPAVETSSETSSETPTPRNIADIEREKGLTSQGIDPSSVENKVSEKGMAGYPPAEVTPEPTFADKVKNWGEGFKNKVTGVKDKLLADVLQKNATPEVPYDLAGSTLKDANEEGLAANRAIQSTEIPKLKRATIKDILLNPEYEGIRDSLASQAINARGANFMKGLAGKEGNYESAIDKYNKEQAARYSADVANRDTTATQAQLDALNAANKRDVGELLQRADFDVEKELERKGLLFDTESKKQVLNQMISDSEEFAKKVPDPDDRLLLTAYQQYLSGDATALDAFITTYGTKLADKLDGLFNTLNGDSGTAYEGKTNVVFGDETLTPEQIDGMSYEALDARLQKLPLEEQDKIISQLEREWGSGSTVGKLRKAYNTRAENASGVASANEELVKTSNEAATNLGTSITEVNEAGYNDKQRVKKLQELETEIDNGIRNGNYTETPTLKTARANLKNEIAKAQLAVSIPGVTDTLNKFVKLDIQGDTLNKESADSSLDYLAKLKWYDTIIKPNTQSVTDSKTKLDAVMGTEGYQNVKNFLSNPNVKAYALDSKNETARKNYKYAVNNFLQTFGGTAKSYGFAEIP